MAIKNQVQLITYPDSLGGDLPALNKVLLKYFSDIFKGGIHILPPFPSSGDRGFAPLTYLEIEPNFGTWDDIRRIGENFDVMLDLMVNHISRQSKYFQDFLKKGRNSEHADMFITVDKIWPDGKPEPEELEKIFLRRPEPFSTFTIEETGEKEKVWTTFGKENPSEQIDLDMKSEVVKNLLKKYIEHFAAQNVKFVRLDAVGYIVKKPGTSCFFVEPEIYQFMDWIIDMANSCGIDMLPEVHAHYHTQFKLSEHGYWIYDFILPYMILDALINKNGEKLCEYLRVRPHKQFTMLDCHDGVPVKPDLNDIVKTEDARKLVDTCVSRGANLSLIFSEKYKDKDGFDVHQIRCSYYSMLEANDDAYISARAIQFFAPGIPQVYYVGLLAGENDFGSVNATGEGRAINRHNYSLEEIDKAVNKDVVQRLLKLIRFRNEYPAFNGEFLVQNAINNSTCVVMEWRYGKFVCTLKVDLSLGKSIIEHTNDNGEMVTITI